MPDWFALILFMSGRLITDWFDGYLARAWKQETKMGAMLDPIADKAMVVIALMILVGYSDRALDAMAGAARHRDPVPRSLCLGPARISG